jgi:hypothetical protein
MLLKKLTINGDPSIPLIDINFAIKSEDELESEKFLIQRGKKQYAYPAVALVGSDSDPIFDLRNSLEFFSQMAVLKKSSSPLSTLGDERITFIIDVEDNGEEHSYIVTANSDVVSYEELIVDGDVEVYDEEDKRSLFLSSKLQEFFSNVVYYDFAISETPAKLINEVVESCKQNNDHFNSLKDYLIQKGYAEDMRIQEDHLLIKVSGEWKTADLACASDKIRMILGSIALDAQQNYQLVIINGLNANCNIYDQVIFIENFCDYPSQGAASQLLFTSNQDCIEWRQGGIFDDQVLLVDFEENSDMTFIKNTGRV